ncbi:MAG: Glu-tRNA(Gln) amidotransferase subunit GatD [Nanoarchaeota archaeon]|nr:Glu-tRNA(Gln) amidotransferase subunit GatD [Nanoarchaeota archaeon]
MYSSKVLSKLKKNKISIGSLIEVSTHDESFTGLLINRPDYLLDDNLIIKLDNGYNIGVSFSKIKSLKLLKKPEKELKKKDKKQTVKKDFISILHTGGTIASKVDYRTGGVVSRFDPEELIKMFPGLEDYGPIHSVFMGNMFSDDMRFAHYAKMADYVKKEVSLGSKGVIITHGTDTMGYSAAALSFIFDNLPIPVILVGAQRSSDRGSSDAEMNILCAAKFIRKSDFRGVAVCMHETSSDDTCVILRGVNVRKMHSSRRDAFKTINDEVIARVEYQDDDITFLSEHEKRTDSLKDFIVKPLMENKVALLKVHTNMMSEQIAFYREKNYKGLVIEGTGLGHLPISEIDAPTKEHTRIRNEVKKLVDSGCAVVMCSQTINGRVNMNVYSPGRDLLNMGVLPGEDMLSETAFVKLAWLLANEKKNVRELIKTNLRGEIKKRLIR